MAFDKQLNIGRGMVDGVGATGTPIETAMVVHGHIHAADYVNTNVVYVGNVKIEYSPSTEGVKFSFDSKEMSE